MWISTLDGFYSIVEHRDDQDVLIVRARDRHDLDRMIARLPALSRKARRFAGWGDPQYTPDADYPWRMYANRDHVTSYMRRAIDHIDYGNYKNAVAATGTRGPRRARLYQRVWAVLLDLEPDRQTYMLPPYRNPLDAPAVPDGPDVLLDPAALDQFIDPADTDLDRWKPGTVYELPPDPVPYER